MSRLFAIGDVHLPSARNKDMDRFGWTGHPEPLRAAWDEGVRADDVVLLVGDISWATRPHEAAADFAWLEARPGKKVLVKGNHDYWWGDSASKLRQFLATYPSFVGFLQNCAVQVDRWVIAGSRLWTTPEAPPFPGGELGDEPQHQEYVEREVRRLGLSIEDAKAKERAAAAPLTRVAAVHFPPLYVGAKATAFSAPIEAFGPKVCVYGHLHGPGIAAGFVGEHGGVRYVLASCDAAKFAPVLLDG